MVNREHIKQSRSIRYPFPSAAAEAAAAERKPGAKIPAPLQSLVDQLGDLRSLLRKAEAEERSMTKELLERLSASGQALQGERFVATRGERQNLVPDVALFVEAVGGLDRATSALRVQIEAAWALVAGDTLAAISESVVVPTLIVREKPAAVAAPRAEVTR